MTTRPGPTGVLVVTDSLGTGTTVKVGQPPGPLFYLIYYLKNIFRFSLIFQMYNISEVCSYN